MPPSVERSAHFSHCGRYLYALWRTWDARRPSMLIIGLNPSTADAIEDDPTIRRCIRFADDRGYWRLAVANLFAYRATRPADLRRTRHPIDKANDRWLLRLAAESDICVAAWGDGGRYVGRDAQIIALLGDVKCLRVTASGAPRHPLYVRAETNLLSLPG